MKTLPNFQPSLVPMGDYIAEVNGEIQEKQSTFDPNKIFLALPLTLIDGQRESFAFSWYFNPRSPRYADFLLAIGGSRLDSGNIQPPPGSYNGRKVMIRIGQRTSKDGRLVNEVLSISRYNAAPSVSTHPNVATDVDDSVPF